MFENYREMSDEEKSAVKAIHQHARSQTEERYGNLAWGFIRGFPYRRIERSTRIQRFADGSYLEHNRPDAGHLCMAIMKVVPGFASLNAPVPEAVRAWLRSEEGAIPAPVREKRQYVRPNADAAQ